MYADSHTLYGVACEMLLVTIRDNRKNLPHTKLPVMLVPSLGRHFFPAEEATKRGAFTVLLDEPKPKVEASDAQHPSDVLLCQEQELYMLGMTIEESQSVYFTLMENTTLSMSRTSGH